jgi:hypothetical protein
MKISTEDIILQSLQITLQDREILTLGNAVCVVENAAALINRIDKLLVYFPLLAQ